MADASDAVDQRQKDSLATCLAPAVRYVQAGSLNTLLSIALYQSALYVASPLIAYGMACLVGIVFAYFAYVRYVFNQVLWSRGSVLFTLFYVASGLVSATVNTALIDYLAMHPRVAIFVTVLIMFPLNYLGSKWCLREKPAAYS